MYLIIGLGNPEEEYAKTRHNMGFDTINKIAKQHQITVTKSKFNSFYGTGSIGKEKVVLVKPQTYMNLSGQAVRKFLDFYKVERENLIIIYDDMDIEASQIKIRKQGGPGGHNGMKSMIEHLASEEFPRVRIGIGKPKEAFDKIHYVIGPVTEEEYKILQKGVEKAAKAVETIVENGIDHAMNQFN